MNGGIAPYYRSEKSACIKKITGNNARGLGKMPRLAFVIRGILRFDAI
jgi:hypothetical protein